MDTFIEIPPEEDPENMPTATEELLQIMEDFADYIDKFMFEIVTFLAVVDSAMGLMKDVLGLFGFEGWKMAFFPTFSFIVTTGVFLFGAKKRKGKRDADVPEGLAEAFDAIEDVMEVVEDVAEGMEEIENEGGGDDGDLGAALGDVVGSSVGLPVGEVAGELQGKADGNGNEEEQGDANTASTPADGNQNIARKVIAVAVLAAGIIAKLKKKRGGGQEEETTMDAAAGGEGSSRDVENQEAGIGVETPQGSSQQNEWQSEKKPAMTGASNLIADNHKSLASTSCGLNKSVIIDLNLADHEKRFAETDWQKAAESNVIATERQIRYNSRQLARGVEQGASEIKHGIERASLREPSVHLEDSSGGITHLDEDNQNSGKLLNKNPYEMASGMVQNTTDMAGSTVQNVDQQARKGVEETRKKSGSILHIAIRLARLAVRIVNKNKGGSSAGSQKGEESTEKAASSDIKGSTVSLESDSIYFDCVASAPKQTQRFGPTCASCKSLMSTGTQTDRDNIQPQYRSEPQFLYHSDSMGMFAQEPRISPWDKVRRSVLSMPDTALMEMRDAANEEMSFRGTPSEQMKKVAEAMELRPAWLGSRDEMAGRLSREVRRANETLLHVGSPHSRFDQPGPSYDEYARILQSHHLDAPVILHGAKDSRTPKGFQEPSTPVSLYTGEKPQSVTDSFQQAKRSAAGNVDNANPGSVSHRDPAVWDRGKGPRARNDHSNDAPEGNKAQSAPDNWKNDGNHLDDQDTKNVAQPGSSDVGVQDRCKGPRVRKGQCGPDDWENDGNHLDDQDTKNFDQPGSSDIGVQDRGKGPRVRKGQCGPDDWEIPDGKRPDINEERYTKTGSSDRGVQDRGKNPRERNIRSSSSYEGLEEYEERSRLDRHSKTNSSKRSSGSQRTIDGKPRNLRRSMSHEQTEDDSVFEEEDLHHDADWRSERSGSNTRLASKTNREKHPRDVSSTKSRHPNRLTSLEDDYDEVAYFPKPSRTRSPIPPSESSGSVESTRSQRRSNVSLSSVRFADEEPRITGAINGRVTRSNSKREKNVDDYIPQKSMKQSGPHDSRRKTASNARWNSAVCLTGHQKAKMSVPSREPYMNDNYISDETGSPRVRHGSRTRVNRVASFNRLSRGPSTMSRTRSAQYLGDDESDERA